MASGPDIESKIEAIRSGIERGRLSKARDRIREVSARRLPRRFATDLAGLARRAYWPEKAAQILYRFVRPTHGSATPGASPGEITEYALALADLGAGSEAIQLLFQVDPASHPAAVSAHAWASFRQWDWESPIPRLERLLESRALTADERSTAELRLATALLHGSDRTEESMTLLEKLRSGSETGTWLHREAAWMIMQNLFYQRQWKSAARALKEVRALHADQERDSSVGLAIEQWDCVISFGLGGGKAAIKRLRAVGKAFAELGRWEKARACAFYEAVLAPEDELLRKLLVGTPYPGFRKKLLNALGRSKEPPEIEDFAWNPPLAGPPGRNRSRSRRELLLRVADGTHNLGDSYLKEGQVMQRALRALCADLFSPPTVAQLHERIYVGEHYNPRSSPIRVHEALHRLRAWIAAGRIPISVTERNEHYLLEAQAPSVLLLPAQGDAGPPGVGAKLRRIATFLREKSRGRPFTSVAASQWLEISRNSAINQLRDAVSVGLAERIGTGPATRYRITGPRADVSGVPLSAGAGSPKQKG